MKDKVIIYGLGKAYKTLKPFIENTFDIVGYGDKRLCDHENYVSPAEFSALKYDYIFVTSSQLFDDIKNDLVRNYGVPENRIESVASYCKRIYVEKTESKDREKTSITDTAMYTSFCKKISEDESLFEFFRLAPPLVTVLEHVSIEQGKEYYQEIQKNRQTLFNKDMWEKFQRNDKYGKPVTDKYTVCNENFSFSPVTMRYIKVLQDVLTLFSNKTIQTICEIGGGYGGQCSIISSYCKNLQKYCIVDLPEVNMLQRRYVNSVHKNNVLTTIDGATLCTDICSDLLISNYAFSELHREVQEVYLKHLIKPAKAGYITWNNFRDEQKTGYTVQEFLQEVPNAIVLEEKPLTHKNNCIIVWGNE